MNMKVCDRCEKVVAEPYVVMPLPAVLPKGIGPMNEVIFLWKSKAEDESDKVERHHQDKLDLCGACILEMEGVVRAWFEKVRPFPLV